MALCVRISGPKTTASVVEAMARVDVLHKQMAVAMAAEEADEEVEAMGPGDDYFMAPYAVVPVMPRKTKYRPNPEPMHWLLYAGYKCREAHDLAARAMGAAAWSVTLGGSIRDVEEGMLGAKVKESKWTRVRRHAWAGGDDVCLKLEEKLAEAACAALGVALDADWRAQRAAAVDTLCDAMGAAGTAAKAAPLAALPEWGSVPFGPLSAAEERAQEAARREHARLEEETRKRNREEAKREADEDRKAKYAPTLARFQGEVPHPDDDLCAYVFDAPGFHPRYPETGEWRCPYDRKPDSPFCAQCRAMVELMTKRARVEA